MKRLFLKYGIVIEGLLLLLFGAYFITYHGQSDQTSAEVESKDYIKWVEFNVTAEALEKAYDMDVATYGQPVHLNWVEMLAYLGTSYGGDFKKYQAKDLDELAAKLTQEQKTMEELTAEREHYPYYLESYTAVLGGLVGEYDLEKLVDEDREEKVWEQNYGLKAFNPIARGYDYSDSDDFGNSRSYGYKRPHLGHDMFGQTGTPIVAVESGYIEALGWNKYGGWRIGIRSFDKKRYYYYAHLRQNFPYNKTLEEGSIITAGDVIGYMGHTGYSETENVNNIKVTHLHWGLQLIFDESQKEGNNEIWINCYELTRFLAKKRCTTKKDATTKEYSRFYQMKDPVVEEFQSKKVSNYVEAGLKS